LSYGVDEVIVVIGYCHFYNFFTDVFSGIIFLEVKKAMAPKHRGRPLTVLIEFIHQHDLVDYLNGHSKGTRMDRVNSTNL
jgi:hypothetical protein